jgi:hypothetical protein
LVAAKLHGGAGSCAIDLEQAQLRPSLRHHRIKRPFHVGEWNGCIQDEQADQGFERSAAPCSMKQNRGPLVPESVLVDTQRPNDVLVVVTDRVEDVANSSVIARIVEVEQSLIFGPHTASWCRPALKPTHPA